MKNKPIQKKEIINNGNLLLNFGFLILISLLFSSLLFSCKPISMNMYYNQQGQKDNSDTDNNNHDWDDEDDDDDDDGDGSGSSEENSVSVFSVICKDGVIEESLFTEDTLDALQQIKDRLPATGSFTSSDIVENNLICSSFTSQNVPQMWYKSGIWEQGDTSKNEYTYKGDNTTAGSNGISNVHYYSYVGRSPFYSADSKYNTATFDTGGETRISRFVFYRFTGDTALPHLDNYLVAVDTYTRLFFAFAIPTASDNLLGQQVPTAWGPVDSICTDSEGKKHKFYEYDPAGYVDDSGNFINSDWYNNNLANSNYTPVYTGLSPYTVTIGEAAEITLTPEIEATTLAEEGILKDSNGFYTEITFKTQTVGVDYVLYRLDDSSEEWVAINESISVAAGESFSYKDYQGLYLTSNPQYKVEAYNQTSGDLFGTSAAVEGSRMLNRKDVLIGAMFSIRLSFDDLWYQSGSVFGDLQSDSESGDSGTYYHGIDRDGFFGTNYRRYQRYVGYKNSLFILDGTFMKDNGGGTGLNDKSGKWTHQGSNWPTDDDFLPRTDSLTVTFGSKEYQITFNDVVISNNDGDAPVWNSGTITVTDEDGNSETFDKDSGIPFSFFMSDEAFYEALTP